MTIPAQFTAALADRYRIERELGQRHGIIYPAHALEHDGKVALEVLRLELDSPFPGSRR